MILKKSPIGFIMSGSMAKNGAVQEPTGNRKCAKILSSAEEKFHRI